MGSLRTMVGKLLSRIVHLVRLILDLLLVDADPQAPYARVLAESDPAALDQTPPTERLLALLSSRSLFTATPLPPGRKTLVLDLDETLIHSTTRGMPDYDTTIEVSLGNVSCIFYVHKRPYADYFLRQVSRWYDLVIFTASTCEYASPVIDWLDPQRLIGQRFYRESCTQRDGNYLKDLTIVERDLSRVFIIDNSPIAYAMVPENAIPIEGWYNDRKDQHLLDLLPFLEALRFCDDVRSVLSMRYTG